MSRRAAPRRSRALTGEADAPQSIGQMSDYLSLAGVNDEQPKVSLAGDGNRTHVLKSEPYRVNGIEHGPALEVPIQRGQTVLIPFLLLLLKNLRPSHRTELRRV